MKPVLALMLPAPMTTPATRAVMALLNDARTGAAAGADTGGGPYALFVGGCVRNAVRGEPIGDIDIATIHEPAAVMDILGAAGVKVIPTGIDHGTVTAVLDGTPYEITTLRRDVATDGRRAVVAFSTDWAEDAARRDFTMNTLLADAEGMIFDPLAGTPSGGGLVDAQQGRVVFVGDPAQRIAEDYLRILRFFRFHARYGAGPADAAALAACAAGAGGLAQLSRERVTDEFMKIFAVDNIVDTLSLMFSCRVLDQFAHPEYVPEHLKALVALQKQGGIDVLTRLAVLSGYDGGHVAGLSQYIVLSNESWGFLDLLVATPFTVPNVREVKYWMYRHDNRAAAQLMMMNLARAGRVGISTDIFDTLRSWAVPALPVSGHDVAAAGISQGPDIGQILRRIETWWIENDYAPDRESCLIYLERLVGRN